MALADELHKDTGNLIRAADWNKLVAAVDKVQTDLVTGIDNLKNQIEQTVTPLQTQVTQLQADFTQLQTRVNNIFTQYAKVTVTATKAVYAIGEVAEIAIQVTDIEGNAFQPGGGRPFIDLITSWGRFKAVPGFETRGGFGDRAISVRTDCESARSFGQFTRNMWCKTDQPSSVSGTEGLCIPVLYSRGNKRTSYRSGIRFLDLMFARSFASH